MVLLMLDLLRPVTLALAIARAEGRTLPIGVIEKLLLPILGGLRSRLSGPAVKGIDSFAQMRGVWTGLLTMCSSAYPLVSHVDTLSWLSRCGQIL